MEWIGFAAILLAMFIGWGLIMSELTDLKDSVTQLSADLDTYTGTVGAEFATLAKQIADLTAQVAAGSPATAQDLIDLKAQVDTVDAAIKAAPVVPAP